MTRNPRWAAPLTLLAALAASAALLYLGEPGHATADVLFHNDTTTALTPHPQETTMLNIIPTRRPLHERLLNMAREHFGLDRGGLGDLDARALADIGVSASEIGSIAAEARGLADVTRLRVVAGLRHA